MTQCSFACEALTCGPLVLSQALYYYATALPWPVEVRPMFVLFMKWGLVGAKANLDIIHIIKFISKETYKYFEGTFHK